MVTETKDLKDMTVEELRALKWRWYQEAHENGSIEKCLIVCRVLGQELRAKYGPKYVYRNGDLELYLDDWGHYATAEFKGKTVMSTHPCTKLFIPGVWMRIVDDEHPAAVSKTRNEEQQQVERERQQLLGELSL